MENLRNFFTFAGIWGLLCVSVYILNTISDKWLTQNVTGFIFAIALTDFIYCDIQKKCK